MAVKTQIQLRRGTSTSWGTTNPTLAAGEIGYDSSYKRIKIGDGLTAWNSLPFYDLHGISSSGGIVGDTGIIVNYDSGSGNVGINIDTAWLDTYLADAAVGITGANGINAYYDSGNSITVIEATGTLLDLYTNLTSTAAELNVLDGVVAGTVSAGDGVVVDSNKDIGNFRYVTATGFIGDVYADNGTTVVLQNSADGTGAVFVGTAGSASGVIATADATDTSRYLTFTNGAGNTAPVYVDTNLSYNPSSNTLSAGIISTTGNVIVGGDLTVAGTTTTVNSTTVEIGDNVIRVNTSGLATGGFEVLNSGTSDYKQFIWNNVTDRWEFAGGENVYTSGTVITNAIQVSDTGTVTNLNSDYLDGQHGSYYLDFGNATNLTSPIVSVDLTGDITGSGNATLTNLADGTYVISLSTTYNNDVVLGTDTSGQYASTITVTGSGITGTSASPTDGTAYTITSSATPANSGNTIVSRDSSGNFAANEITANLIGNASTATRATNADNIEVDVSSANTNHIVFVNGTNGDLKPNVNSNLRFDAANNIMYGDDATTPTTKLEYFIIDGGTP